MFGVGIRIFLMQTRIQIQAYENLKWTSSLLRVSHGPLNRNIYIFF
jgi:hypothetical protein